jgi:hypothetical protein
MDVCAGGVPAEHLHRNLRKRLHRTFGCVSVMEPTAGAIYPHFGTWMRVCAISEAASRLTNNHWYL